MPRIIKHWNVMVATQETIQSGIKPLCLGKSMTDKPVIEHGFLMYVDHGGSHAGVNLSEVAIFSIEAEFEE